ncbi:hypothetical protein [Staphylococcus saprophyticus]|uniref:hypothetical protein n=1 Tax=Staphylococcus saprophyticus TaxID=29385 RepID=UPI00101132A7|nr:hypothetical protein [Staphylococcus saprophyticus]RXS13359.1 hypothetical protein EUA46_11350 [Staphylococcus saprophyticus]
MLMQIHPDKGEPYFYKSMIGKHVVFGTDNPAEATKLTFQEFWEVCELINNFLSCRPILILD